MEKLMIGFAPHDVDDVTEWITLDEARFKTLDGLQIVGLDGTHARDMELIVDDIEDMDATEFVRVAHLALRLADKMSLDVSYFYFNGLRLVMDPLMTLSDEIGDVEFEETLDKLMDTAREMGGRWNGTYIVWDV